MQILIISPVNGYAHCVAEHDQFPSHIWIGNQRDIHSCTSYLVQVDLTDPMHLQVKTQLISSNLKSCFGHGPLAVNSIRGILCLGCWFQFLKTFPAMPCLHSNTCIHSYGTQSILLCWPCKKFHLPFHKFWFNPAGCLVTFLIRKVWWRNWFSCWWPKYMAGN